MGLSTRQAIPRVSLTGAPTIDPSQTAMPAHWSQYASYILAEDKTLVLKEKIRGLVKNKSMS